MSMGHFFKCCPCVILENQSSTNMPLAPKMLHLTSSWFHFFSDQHLLKRKIDLLDSPLNYIQVLLFFFFSIPLKGNFQEKKN